MEWAADWAVGRVIGEPVSRPTHHAWGWTRRNRATRRLSFAPSWRKGYQRSIRHQGSPFCTRRKCLFFRSSSPFFGLFRTNGQNRRELSTCLATRVAPWGVTSIAHRIVSCNGPRAVPETGPSRNWQTTGLEPVLKFRFCQPIGPRRYPRCAALVAVCRLWIGFPPKEPRPRNPDASDSSPPWPAQKSGPASRSRRGSNPPGAFPVHPRGSR